MSCSRLLSSRTTCITSVLSNAVGAVCLALLLLLPLGSLWAQAKPMTITAVTGMTFIDWDPDAGITTYNLGFTVKNTGSQTASLYVYRDCGDFCGESGPWSGVGATLAAGQSTTVIVPFYVGVDQWDWASTITLAVWAQVGGALQSPLDIARVTVDFYFRTATLDPPSPPPIAWYRPSVTPKSGSIVVRQGNSTTTFAVQNTGTVQATYALAANCGSMSGCTVPASVTVNPGASANVSVGFTTPPYAGATDAVSLGATYTNANGQQVSDSGSVNISTPLAQPAVAAWSASPSLAANGVGSAAFTVTNSGVAGATFHLVPICEGWTTSCTTSATDVSLDAGGSQVVSLSYAAPATLGGPGVAGAVVRLAAQLLSGGQVITADTAWLPAVLAYSLPSISPKSATVTEGAGAFQSPSLTVTNTGNATASFVATVNCPTSMGCINWNTYPINLAPGASAPLIYGYYAPAVGQTATFQAIVTHNGSGGLAEADTARRISTGADLNPPVITLTAPAEGATVSVAAQNLGVTVVDPDGVLQTPSATLNASAITTTYTTSTYGGGGTMKTGTYALLVRAGINTLVASATDGIHSPSVIRHYTYDEAPQHTPVVTPAIASEVVAAGLARSDTFTVRNPGPLSVTYMLTAQCSTGNTGCTPSQTSVTVAGSQSAKVWVSYTAASTGSSGTVQLTATLTGATGHVVSSGALISFTLDHIPPTAGRSTSCATGAMATLGTLPTIAVQWCDADGALAVHDVRIDGVLLPDAFMLMGVAGCASAGTSTWTNYAAAQGTHSLTATVIRN